MMRYSHIDFQEITLRFTNFDLFDDPLPDCEEEDSDYLTMQDGPDASSRMVVRLCGKRYQVSHALS